MVRYSNPGKFSGKTCFDQSRLLEDIAKATEFCKGLQLEECNGSCRGSQNSKLTLLSLTPALPSSNQVFTQVEMFKRVWFFLVVLEGCMVGAVGVVILKKVPFAESVSCGNAFQTISRHIVLDSSMPSTC